MQEKSQEVKSVKVGERTWPSEHDINKRIETWRGKFNLLLARLWYKRQ